MAYSYTGPSQSFFSACSVTVCSCFRKTLQTDSLAPSDFVTYSSISKSWSETFLLYILGDSILLCPHYLLLGWEGTHRF